MQARIRKTMDERAKGDKGFTLIELLVVIIIIGILAAIAIPSFLNQREKGWASQAQAALKNAAIAAESYSVDNNGTYTGLLAPAADTASTKELFDYGYTATSAVTVTINVIDGTKYELVATHASLGITKNEFKYQSTTGTIGAAY